MRRTAFFLESITFLLILIIFPRRFFLSLLLFSSLAADAFRSHFRVWAWRRDLRCMSNFAIAGDDQLPGISNHFIEVASSQHTWVAGNIICTQRTALTLRVYEIFKAWHAVRRPPGTMNVWWQPASQAMPGKRKRKSFLFLISKTFNLHLAAWDKIRKKN